MKKICIATSTRADWGILTPLAESLRNESEIELQILATNMHLLDEYGFTANEIEAGGFKIDARVEMPPSEVGAVARAVAMGECLAGTAPELERLSPDAIVILGDRFEMLAIASAATLLLIPIIHISGGETTGGAIDDSIRHAITQLASLHLVSAEPYRQRVIRMGANPEKVVNTGSLGVWNMMNRPYLTREELASTVGFDAERRFAVATFHPATLDSASPGLQCRQMLAALDEFPDIFVVLTYPNNDTGSEEVIEAINEWIEKNSDRGVFIKSLGLKRYLSAIREAEFVIGNSSSGIIEVPSVKTPVINIGVRQQGRLHGEGVLDCGNSVTDIAKAIKTVMSDEFNDICRRADNPYYQPDTLNKTVDAIKEFVNNV